MKNLTVYCEECQDSPLRLKLQELLPGHGGGQRLRGSPHLNEILRGTNRSLSLDPVLTSLWTFEHGFFEADNDTNPVYQS